MKPFRSISSFATTAAISFGVLAASLSSSACAQSCPGDLNGDGQVNGADLGALLATWGICPVLAPTISSVNPGGGPQTGGTLFVVNGTNLNGATSVTVDGMQATITAAYATIIAATAPAGTLGPKDVVVTTPGGTATAVGAFTYTSPLVPAWATVIEFAPDPAVVTNATMRAAITATNLPWRVRDTAANVEMLLVPAGTFTMGCTASNQYGCYSEENPTHAVIRTQAFYMGRYEVTQAQWVAKMGNNPSHSQGASYPNSESRPVEMVSWNAVQGYLSATGMRLPSEAEWEYACRAGTTTAFNNGSSDDATAGTIAWYNSNSGSQTHAVGGRAANALGFYDMSGNVFEWVNDWYGSTYYSYSPSTNPFGPIAGTYRVIRGGCWYSLTNEVRSSDRGGAVPNGASDGIGFRVARNP